MVVTGVSSTCWGSTSEGENTLFRRELIAIGEGTEIAICMSRFSIHLISQSIIWEPLYENTKEEELAEWLYSHSELDTRIMWISVARKVIKKIKQKRCLLRNETKTQWIQFQDLIKRIHKNTATIGVKGDPWLHH